MHTHLIATRLHEADLLADRQWIELCDLLAAGNRRDFETREVSLNSFKTNKRLIGRFALEIWKDRLSRTFFSLSNL